MTKQKNQLSQKNLEEASTNTDSLKGGVIAYKNRNDDHLQEPVVTENRKTE